MIALADCQAFCDADDTLIEQFARHESLPQIAACARAQAMLGTLGRADEAPAASPAPLALAVARAAPEKSWTR